METNDRNQTLHKKPYAKPEIKRVMLRPEEAVLAACKKATQAGPGQATCNVPSACSSLLS